MVNLIMLFDITTAYCNFILYYIISIFNMKNYINIIIKIQTANGILTFFRHMGIPFHHMRQPQRKQLRRLFNDDRHALALRCRHGNDRLEFVKLGICPDALRDLGRVGEAYQEILNRLMKL